MKRYGNLKQHWCTYDALVKAVNEVKKNKTYHESYLRYESNLAVNLESLLRRLQTNTYHPQPAREFYVYEPKKRLIHAPALEDRIVQHALLAAVRDKIENRFVYHSFACRKEKGTHKANAILKSYLTSYKGEGYYLKLDIAKFFYNINHKVLEQQIRKIIKCEDTVQLLKKFYVNDAGVGLPLGNVTSQVLANLALNPVDHFIKRELKHKHYLRYMDDLVIVDKCKEKLKASLKKIIALVSSLKLKINSKTHIGKLKNGIDFVGFKTHYNRKVIRKRTLHNVKRKLKKNDDVNRVSSFLAHAKETNSIIYVVKTILSIVPQRAEFVHNWIINNQGDIYDEIFQSQKIC